MFLYNCPVDGGVVSAPALQQEHHLFDPQWSLMVSLFVLPVHMWIFLRNLRFISRRCEQVEVELVLLRVVIVRHSALWCPAVFTSPECVH